MTKRMQIVLLSGAAVAILTSAALAWHAAGHRRATSLAAHALPEALPDFFRNGTDLLAHCACDPDTFRRPFAHHDLHGTEAPEHYFDIELLDGHDLPRQRYDFLKWCFANDIAPVQIGLAPYAVHEWTQRLTVAFAEHRRWPDNPSIRAKCLVYAGLLAHYAQDLCQPLHTTIHYNGRVGPDRQSPKTGIHQKVDALIGKLPASARPTIDPNNVQPFGDLFADIVDQALASHERVDRVYELEGQLPAEDAPLDPDSPVGHFAAERLKDAATFTARLYLTAWENSADVALPEWHDRPTETTGG